MTGISDLHQDIPSSGSTGSGPGRLVRQARETAKLSVEDLASLIKLSRFTLDAIERDDFGQLNEPVYVRGYYRKLSKVLPVNETELMAAYERVAGHKTPPHPSKLILAGGPELGSGRRISVKLAAAIIVLGLLVGALAFWGKNRQSGVVGAERSAAAPVVNPPPASGNAPGSALPPATLAPSPSTAEPVVDGAVPAEAKASVAAATDAPATASSLVGPLQMQFDGSSWTEVKDASGRVLLSGLIDAGGSQTLDGRPPFVVFLGNAPAVKIIYQGQPVDTAPFKRGDNTARITLP